MRTSGYGKGSIVVLRARAFSRVSLFESPMRNGPYVPESIVQVQAHNAVHAASATSCDVHNATRIL
ncbi:MAG: hypothetical protein R3F24_00325 [Gammaproteobacteria bacterium]